MTNIAMENGPFIDEFTINTSIYKGFSMAMLVITRWYLLVVGYPIALIKMLFWFSHLHEG